MDAQITQEEIDFILNRSIAVAAALRHTFGINETTEKEFDLSTTFEQLKQRIPPEFVPVVYYLAQVSKDIKRDKEKMLHSKKLFKIDLMVCSFHLNIPPLSGILHPIPGPPSLNPFIPSANNLHHPLYSGAQMPYMYSHGPPPPIQFPQFRQGPSPVFQQPPMYPIRNTQPAIRPFAPPIEKIKPHKIETPQHVTKEEPEKVNDDKTDETGSPTYTNNNETTDAILTEEDPVKESIPSQQSVLHGHVGSRFLQYRLNESTNDQTKDTATETPTTNKVVKKENENSPSEINFFSGQTLDSDGSSATSTEIGETTKSLGTIGQFRSLSVMDRMSTVMEESKEFVSDPMDEHATSALKALLNLEPQIPLSEESPQIKVEEIQSITIKRRIDIDPEVFPKLDTAFVEVVQQESETQIKLSKDDSFFVLICGTDASKVAKAKSMILQKEKNLRQQLKPRVSKGTEKKSVWAMKASASKEIKADTEDDAKKMNELKLRTIQNLVDTLSLDERSIKALHQLSAEEATKVLDSFKGRKHLIKNPSAWVQRTCNNMRKKVSTPIHGKSSRFESKSRGRKGSNKTQDPMHDLPELEILSNPESENNQKDNDVDNSNLSKGGTPNIWSQSTSLIQQLKGESMPPRYQYSKTTKNIPSNDPVGAPNTTEGFSSSHFSTPWSVGQDWNFLPTH